MSEVPLNRRMTPRFRVKFRGSFTGEGEHTVEGEGTVIDISVGGCRVETETMVPAGSYLELRIHVSGVSGPVRIERGLVPWSRGREFGVGFIRVPPEEQKRLSQIVQELQSDASEE
jgi:c-di-GMP-binding flagellar brake protein YcgR